MAIDQRLLRLEINKQAGRVLINKVRPLIKSDFEDKKAKFMAEFEADPVTEELRAGPEATSSVLSQGNLFSLLGFYKEQQPIDQLREYLNDNVVLYKTQAGKTEGSKIVFKTPVAFPNESEIDTVMASNEQTKLEWTHRSFTSQIANGVDGFSRYLFAPKMDFSRVPSRSGPAVQADHTLRSAEAPPIPYIKRLLGVLKGLITKSNK